MLKKIPILFLLVIFSPAFANAHGENKPGPHGGFIRMPGAFHTEVVQVGADKAKIYLLDMNWKEPSVKNSKLEVRVGAKGSATCAIQAESYFLCSFPKGIDLSKKGTLKIKAQREGQMGNEISYELPLKLQVIDDGHGAH